MGWEDVDQKKAAKARSKSKKFAKANKKKSQDYWNSLTAEERSRIAKKRWTKERREERSRQYSGAGNPLYGKKRHHSDETKMKMRKSANRMFGKDNPATRPEVRAKMRKKHRMSKRGSEILAKIGTKNLLCGWKHNRAKMIAGTMKSLSHRHRDYPHICKDGTKVLMMSSWEVRFAKILERMDIDYQYNQVCQKGPVHGILSVSYFYRGGWHRYYPDFLIKSTKFPYDFVEVKGKPVSERDKAKFEFVKKAGFRILLANRQVLEMYEKNLKTA